MPVSSNSQKDEQPNTYMIQGRRNETELKRLAIQDHLVTDIVMGEVLAGQANPYAFQNLHPFFQKWGSAPKNFDEV